MAERGEPVSPPRGPVADTGYLAAGMVHHPATTNRTNVFWVAFPVIGVIHPKRIQMLKQVHDQESGKSRSSHTKPAMKAP